MTFKPNAVKRVVTGSFHKIDGSYAEGSIHLELSDHVLGREEHAVYTTQPIPIELDETGSFNEELAVTMPGLTTRELDELNDLQALREQNLQDLSSIHEDIQEYLNKLASNLAVTEDETDQYNADIETKGELQATAIELAEEYQELLDKQLALADYEVRLRVRLDLKNPMNKKKIEFIIPQGTEPIDISELPRV